MQKRVTVNLDLVRAPRETRTAIFIVCLNTHSTDSLEPFEEQDKQR